MEIGLLLIRIVIGVLFIGHGTQKLFGWFNGPGPEGTGQFFGSVGYPRGKLMGRLAGATEAGAGLLLVLGLFMPLAAAAIVGTMLNAGVVVHRDNGLWNDQGGYEYPLVLSAVALALALTGPGAIAVGAAAGVTFAGWAAGLTALAAGLVIGGLVLATRRSEPAHAEAQPAEEREYADAVR